MDMTERLYYTDPYAREFNARVVKSDVVDGRPVVILDRTAFYPASGGQPFDIGTLGGSHVVDVIDDDRQGILHVLDAPLHEGESVRGTIDWERRFDHMQQHTGQHLLSAAFDRLLDARTESFHLGTASSTIDLARLVTTAEIFRAEAEANRIVWEDRPVSIRFVDASAAATLALRKESLREGTLRLIDIQNYDVSACGGTHVTHTGAIGMIAVASWEKIRGGSRIEFVCGGRTLDSYRTLRDTMLAAGSALSTSLADLPVAVVRLQAETKKANRTVKDLQIRLARYEAQRLASREPDAREIVEVLEGWDQNGLKAIASALTSRAACSVLLVSAPSPSNVVVARSADGRTDAAAVLRALLERFGGKGGGRPDLAQGGGLQGDPHEIASFARELLQRQGQR